MASVMYHPEALALRMRLCNAQIEEEKALAAVKQAQETVTKIFHKENLDRLHASAAHAGCFKMVAEYAPDGLASKELELLKDARLEFTRALCVKLGLEEKLRKLT